MQIYFYLLLPTLHVPLQIGKCTPGGYMYPRLGTPGLEPALNVGKYREGGVKTFFTFRFSTKCRENREGKPMTFPMFRFSTKCREIVKARRSLSLHFQSTLNVGK